MMCFGVKDRKRVKTNHCVIVLLDDTQLVHELHASSTGQDLLDVVIKHLNLLETSYFGLKYLSNSRAEESNGNKIYDNNSSQYIYNNSTGQAMNGLGSLSGAMGPRQQVEQIWLDVNKSALKQLKDVEPMIVYFGVKYYAADPCKLAEEITRYQFFLQCKQDILHQRLPINFDLAIELFALAVQSELGDYDPIRHQDGYINEFHFLPNQSLEMERRVSLLHRNLIGQVPATAELNFLERIKWLDLYGAQLHPIQYDDGSLDSIKDDYSLAINPTGILVLRNKLKVAHYHWMRIIKTKCQGRCFLMDVIDLSGNSSSSAAKSSGPGSGGKPERNRFGFRLAHKQAARNLRWSIEEHKSFYHLIHNSATIGNNSLALRQQAQTPKLSTRFRNSIRSAINVGPFGGLQMAAVAQQQQQQQHKLRSSMKSLGHQNISERPPPTVVRMPSRRYSNRSSGKPFAAASATAHSNQPGLPPAPAGPGSAHTMVESQRQQAILLMNQMQQQHFMMMGKSQTLKPTHSSREPRARSQYYNQLMSMMQQQPGAQPEIAILPPGRHIVQPTIYKSASTINGLNQLGGAHGAALADLKPSLQFYNTQARPSYQGHESPRSTKSAIAPSSAIKLASKKLAKQQQLFFANRLNNDATQPLIDYREQGGQFYEQAGAYLYGAANQSPRSTRSVRASDSRNRLSKSTIENLHLLGHQLQKNTVGPINAGNAQMNNSKMLLATTQQMFQQQQQLQNRHQSIEYPMVAKNHSDEEAEYQLQQGQQFEKRRANLPQPPRSMAHKQQQKPARGQQQPFSDQEDDYCCSRSDCSSIRDENCNQLKPARRRRVPTNQAPTMGSADSQRKSQANHLLDNQQQLESWQAIRKRHNEFSNGKGNFSSNIMREANGFGGGNEKSSPPATPMSPGNVLLDPRRQPIIFEDRQGLDQGQLKRPQSESVIKNIQNKQATPILLSMNFNDNNSLVSNNKAIKLLNLQRQQLNNNNPSSEINNNGATGKGLPSSNSSSAVGDSTPSSMASSPQTNQQQQQQPMQAGGAAGTAKGTLKTSDSTSSTTSGYYACSNSTGSASADSDSQATSAEQLTSSCGDNNGPNKQSNQIDPIGHQAQTKSAKVNHPNYPTAFNDYRWNQEEGSRVKIALGSYAARMSGNRLVIGNAAQLNNSKTKLDRKQSQELSYFNDSNNNENLQTVDNQNNDGQWLSMNHQSAQQQAPSSLKYVSFDV